jgi:hypothetical protein
MEIISPSCAPYAPTSCKEMSISAEFTGVERRLDELNERLARLQPLRDKARIEFDEDIERFGELARRWPRQTRQGMG